MAKVNIGITEKNRCKGILPDKTALLHLTKFVKIKSFK